MIVSCSEAPSFIRALNRLRDAILNKKVVKRKSAVILR